MSLRLDGHYLGERKNTTSALYPDGCIQAYMHQSLTVLKSLLDSQTGYVQKQNFLLLSRSTLFGLYVI